MDNEREDSMFEETDYNLLILGASGGRIDHTFNVYRLSCKYNDRFRDIINAKFFLLGESSLSLILNPKCVNVIDCSSWSFKKNGYSILPISGNANIHVEEINNDNINEIVEKDCNISYKNYLFRKVNLPSKVKIIFKKLSTNERESGFFFNLSLN